MNYDEMLEIYGDVEVTFSSYYKFMFSYVGKHKGKRVSVTVGDGSADGIYKQDVTTQPIKISDLGISFLSIDGEKIYTDMW